MAKRKQQPDVTFIVEFEDGETAMIAIDNFTLRTGDHIARIIAKEWQDGGRLPAKPIKSVKRAPGQGPDIGFI